MTTIIKASTRERVLSVAGEMFLSQGIRSVRMDDIARQCGISKRTIYEIFKDREEIIEQCLLRHAAEIHQSNMAIAAKGENALHASWLIFTEGHKFCQGKSTLIEEVNRYYPQVMKNLIEITYEEIVKHNLYQLEKGMADELIMSELDLNFFSRALTNYVYGLGLIEASMAQTGVIITEQTLPIAILVFLRGISTEKGRRYIDENLLKQ